MRTEIVLQGRSDPKMLSLKLRFYLSKYSIEGIDEDEYLQIWLITLTLLERNPKGSYRRINSFQLSLLMKDMHTIIPNGKPRGGQKIWPIGRYIVPSLVSGHEYYGLKYNPILSRVKLEQKVLEKISFPEPARIGVGYKDKGNARNSAWDGCPDWKDVSTKLTRNGRLEVQRVNNLLTDPETVLQSLGTELYAFLR